MNIAENYSNLTCDHGVHALYRTIPGWRQILIAVRAGQAEFANLLARTGLVKEFGVSTSAVHDYQDIEVHAFILGIVSAGRPEEVQTKSFLTYASHWIDDFFDGDMENGNFSQLLADRQDIATALTNMGPSGAVGFAMAERARHPMAVYKALHRMLYGGLVQRSVDRIQRESLVGEYACVASQFVDRELVEEIGRLQPAAYWATNKTVLELLFAAEEQLDFTTELWNLVYAPAIYYQDADAERERGELSFEEEEAPRLGEMIRMIRVGARRLAERFERNSSLEFQQLRFAARALPNLPKRVVCQYRALWQGAAQPWSERNSAFGQGGRRSPNQEINTKHQ